MGYRSNGPHGRHVFPHVVLWNMFPSRGTWIPLPYTVAHQRFKENISADKRIIIRQRLFSNRKSRLYLEDTFRFQNLLRRKTT